MSAHPRTTKVPAFATGIGGETTHRHGKKKKYPYFRCELNANGGALAMFNAERANNGILVVLQPAHFQTLLYTNQVTKHKWNPPDSLPAALTRPLFQPEGLTVADAALRRKAGPPEPSRWADACPFAGSIH
jgi:hypothetical protein